MPLRVVLDTNCFNGQSFELLAASSMHALSRRGVLVPIFGAVVIHEVCRAYGRESRREALLRSWIPFIRDSRGEFKRDFQDLWHQELVQNLGIRANPNLSTKVRDRLFQAFAEAPMTGEWELWEAMKHELMLDRQKRDAMHELRKAVRMDLANGIQQTAVFLRGSGDIRMTGQYEREVVHLGYEYILRRISAGNPRAIASRWTRAKEDYPYFTEAMRGYLFSLLYPAANPNAKLDRNAQEDIDVMTHLLDADVIVSNETNFLRHAFDALWRPRGKVMMTVPEFVAHMQRMADR